MVLEPFAEQTACCDFEMINNLRSMTTTEIRSFERANRYEALCFNDKVI